MSNIILPDRELRVVEVSGTYFTILVNKQNNILFYKYYTIDHIL